MSRSYQSWIALLGIVIIGTAGGVYLGTSLSSGRLVPPLKLLDAAERPRLVAPDEEFVAAIGEPFPQETFVFMNDSIGRFQQFFDGTPSVLLFWSLGCGPCIDQARMWQEQIDPLLTPGVKQIVCVADFEKAHVSEYSELLSEKVVVLINYDHFIRDLHLVLSPTIMFLDGEGIVEHIQYGYSTFFDEELHALLVSNP